MEADVLRWSLLIIGSLVILGLAVHGIWISRKNNENNENNENNGNNRKQKKDQEYQPSAWHADDDDFANIENPEKHPTEDVSDIKFDIRIDDEVPDIESVKTTTNEFDDLGIGAVRVVSSDQKDVIDEPEEQIATTNIQTDPATSSSKIYASVVTQPKPEYAAKFNSPAAKTVAISQQDKAISSNNSGSPQAHSQQYTGTSNQAFGSGDHYQAPEPPPFLLKKTAQEPQTTIDPVSEVKQPTRVSPTTASLDEKVGEQQQATLAEKLSLSEQARNLVKRKKADSVRNRREPKIAEDQMRIDFDDQPIADHELKEALKAKPSEVKQPQNAPQEVLVLNVKSTDDNPIPGSALLPMLLTLGFKFGDQDIFHRHVNSNGKGPVLFSLANMFKPGNFDIDNLENFTTQGISLFMILPIEGEPHQVFNMMHNAARKIAEEFSAQIYDGKRILLTKQSLQQYVEKIREFERQRLLQS